MFVNRLAMMIILLLAAGCQKTDERAYRTGDVLVNENFDRSFGWETYRNDQMGADLRVEDGFYRMTLTKPGYIWGLNVQAHDNVVIETQASQLSDDSANTGYGVICRADPSNNGGGYFFLITGDGYWSIRLGSVVAAKSLVEFTRSDAIHLGRSINTVRAVCIDDYLALYVNDRFVGATYDSRYQRGFAGLTVAMQRQGAVDVTFDYVKVTPATLIP